MKEPTATISLRLSNELWHKIHDLVDGKSIPDLSHATRSLIEAGLWLNENKNDLRDPEKTKKIIEEYNSKLNEKDVFDWVGQLPDNQIQALQIAFQLEREKRYQR